MKNRMTPRLRLVSVGLACAVLGVGGGAVLNATARDGGGHAARGDLAGGQHGKHGAGRLLRHVVHGDLVVGHGKTFGNVTIDRGKVVSMTSSSVTIAEGTRKASYKTVTLPIPANARIRDNHKKATLADLKAGQRIMVVKLPKRTLVRAHDARMHAAR